MKVFASICEYNPFHNGHKYLIDESKKIGATHVIAIMSGNFVQRGDVAICSKWARAKSALLNGVNLVVELPVVFSLARAEKFAASAVFLANSLGVVDNLVFGCECADIELLKKAAAAVVSPAIKRQLAENLKTGVTFANARETAVCSVFGEDIGRVLGSANNNLAVEYLKSLRILSSKIEPISVLREGSGHDSSAVSENFSSASLIRGMALSGNYDFSRFMPRSSYNVLMNEIVKNRAPGNIKNMERAVLAKLREITLNDLFEVPDISEGLENRIYRAVKDSTSLFQLYDKIKAKRYTSARIRRIILSAFLGITKEICSYSPAYVRVLAVDSLGIEILRKMKQTCSLPIITEYSQFAKDKNYRANSIFNIENRASNLYALCTPDTQKCELEKTNGIIVN